MCLKILRTLHDCNELSQTPSARNSTVDAKVRFNSYHLYRDRVFKN